MRASPIGSVAAVAVGVGGSEIVIIVDVAEGAGRGGMSAGEWEAGDTVIEGCGGPRGSVVALRAIGGSEWSARLRVRGVVGLLPGGEVAAGVAAVGGGNLKIVVVVDVATGTGDVGVARGERKTSDAMVKGGGSPRSGVVALRAIGDGK